MTTLKKYGTNTGQNTMSGKVKEDMQIIISLNELKKMKLTSSELSTVSKIIDWVMPLKNDKDLKKDFIKIEKLHKKIKKLLGNP